MELQPPVCEEPINLKTNLRSSLEKKGAKDPAKVLRANPKKSNHSKITNTC